MHLPRKLAVRALAILASVSTLHGNEAARDAIPRVESPQLLAPGTDIGMWVSDREDIATPAERARLLQFCRTYGINRLLVQVPYERRGNGYDLALPEALRVLLADFARAGITIEALDGSAEMAFADNRANTLAMIQAILAFNRAQPDSARFAGIHLDIEPYVSERWKAGDVAAIMHEFLDTAVAIRDAVRASDPRLTVAYDIPSWFDQAVFELDYAGARKSFNQHIQDLSDYVGIMSYRTRATGPNSAVDISAGELAYGTKIGRPVYLSLETVSLPDTPTITFHGRPAAEYVATIRELAAHRTQDPVRGGILLHYYRTIRPLLEPDTLATRL